MGMLGNDQEKRTSARSACLARILSKWKFEILGSSQFQRVVRICQETATQLRVAESKWGWLDLEEFATC